ncbi:Imm50 family immunity protein [Ralstonia insidiosa]|uniref:Imm50 family immunity protein n=1 Tax=Ralstonia insidiosa TaxID=190721 RepID=UPI001427E7BE|nr:Imm50 family immunity protein [Ralstonia insidiosa]
MDAFQQIEAHQKILDVFGCWPSFHDGEVHRVVLDRGAALGPTVELTIRGWNLTPEITEAGFYKQEADSLVHFRFEGVSDLVLDGLNHQNVLTCLEFEQVDATKHARAGLLVTLEHCFGLCGQFRAERASIVSVKPYVEPTA